MLSVITHTRFDRPDLLERCKESVAAALPENAQHLVIDGNVAFSDFGKLRYDALACSEYIAFVDDDDTIHPDSLKLCYDAIRNNNVALAFTDEQIVDSEGKRICPIISGERSYAGITSGVRHAHHLSIIKTDVIDDRVLDLHNKYDAGLQWFMIANAAMVGGAVHVPMVGYSWHRHESQTTATKYMQQIFTKRLAEMTQDIRNTWGVRSGFIPQIQY